ncbi:MAG: hypothetical protein NC452_09985, partial [Eubacterium sp.]|nr:hypothetical protein [Eubacterium sp.]
MFSIHPFAELLNDLRLRRKGNFAPCGERPKGFSPFGNLASCAQLDQLCRGFAAEKHNRSSCAKQ